MTTSDRRVIFVTGGAGYIGSHACKALHAEGYLPVVIDNLKNGRRDFVKWGPLLERDLLDEEDLKKAFIEWQPHAVMHFASLISVGESVKNPKLYYRNNVEGSESLLRAMKSSHCRTMVFSSSAAVYGTPKNIPVDESAPLQPINPYGEGKKSVEKMISDAEKDFGLKSVSLRYFNAAGADADGELGECHEPETHLIPLVLEVATGRRDQVTLYGNSYDTPDGTCIRDYIHVSDLADAHLSALRYLERGGSSIALNLGTGQGHSNRSVVAAAEKVSQKKIICNYGPPRVGDVPVLVADASRAQKTLGWSPKHSHLDQILHDAWKWHNR